MASQTQPPHKKLTLAALAGLLLTSTGLALASYRLVIPNNPEVSSVPTKSIAFVHFIDTVLGSPPVWVYYISVSIGILILVIADLFVRPVSPTTRDTADTPAEAE